MNEAVAWLITHRSYNDVFISWRSSTRLPSPCSGISASVPAQTDTLRQMKTRLPLLGGPGLIVPTVTRQTSTAIMFTCNTTSSLGGIPFFISLIVDSPLKISCPDRAIEQ